MSGPVGARDGDPPKSLPDFDLALVLSGGNALGAFQAGAYQQLHEAGLEPALVSGASAGAINGAIICGAPPDQRVSRLEAFWKPAARSAWGMTMFEEARRTAAAVGAIAGGQPDLFVPRHLWGPWWNPFGNPEPSSLYDATALEHRLAQLIDFDLLNDGATPFCATAVNVETGENVVLDTRQQRIGARHIRASAALIPFFSPVRVDDRWLADGGFSTNLPLDPVLAAPPVRPLLCLAVDLLPLHSGPPDGLGAAASRAQDLIFAAQSRRSIAAWQAIYDGWAAAECPPSITLLHLSYGRQNREVSGKALDFSAESAADRWQAGRQAMEMAVAKLRANELAIGRPGLTVCGDTAAGPLNELRWSLGPATACQADPHAAAPTPKSPHTPLVR